MNIILIGTAAVVLIYNLLFFHIGFGLGTGLIFLVLNFYYLILRDKQNPRNFSFALFNSILSTVFAFSISWRDSGIVLLINFLSSIFFLLNAIYFYQDRNAFHFSIPQFLLTPLSLFGSVLETFFGEKVSNETALEKQENTAYKAVIKGLVITVPIFLVLLLLLTQADPIFQKLTGDLFQSLGERLVISALIFVGLFIVAMTKVKEKFTKIDEAATKVISKDKVYELIIILSSLAVLFSAFIIVQFQYLFANVSESELAKLGVASLTYSEYVRKGFSELLVVSVISISVLLYILKYLHNLVASHKLSVQILASVFTVETGLILLSAAQRDILYAGAHGLTRARVFGFIFLVWLAVFLLLMLVKVIIDLPKKILFSSILAITVLALFSFSVINVDGLIATNYKPTVNGEIDYYYLTSISNDAYPSWVPALQDINQLLNTIPATGPVSGDQQRKLTYARLTLENLTDHLDLLENKYASDETIARKFKNEKDGVPQYVKDSRNWQSLNISQYQAYNYVLQNKELFTQIPALRAKIDILTKSGNGVPVQLDRSTNAPFTQN